MKVNHSGNLNPNLLHAALWYAQRGWAVFPLHEPLFQHPQGYTCSCEDWRHSEDCQSKRPDLYLTPGQHCDQPGKHPRGVKSWQAAATTDAATVRAWWTKYPTANIGIDCGRSGLLVLDFDLYKHTMQPADWLTLAEQCTTTVLTGSGGLHLIYQMPPGQRYGNAKGQLAAGIDVRGVSGYIVAAPSLHASGRRYQYEAHHNPAQLAPQPLPTSVQAMLEAVQPTKPTSLTTFAAGTVAKPDLCHWRLSERILHAIHYPSPQGQRSECDQAVILALVTQGATDDEIRAVFTHYPIGEKYRQEGEHYLAVSIGKARTYLTQQNSVPALVDANGETIVLADLLAFCRDELARRQLRPSQEQVALAILQIFERAHAIQAPRSDRHLAGLAAVTHKTANGALKGMPILTKGEDEAGNRSGRKRMGRRTDGLDQWLVTRIAQGNGILADTYKLADAIVMAYRADLPTKVHQGVNGTSGEPGVALWGDSRAVLTTVERHMVDDAFVRHVPPRTFRRKARYYTLSTGERLAQVDALLNSPTEADQQCLKAFSPIGLRVIAHLEVQNGLDYTELAKRMRLHPATIATAVERLRRRRVQARVILPLVRVVKMDSHKRVFLYHTWQKRLAELRPLLLTDSLLMRRQVHYSTERIKRLKRVLTSSHLTEATRHHCTTIKERTQHMLDAVRGTPPLTGVVQHRNAIALAANRTQPKPAQPVVLRVQLGLMTSPDFGQMSRLAVRTP